MRAFFLAATLLAFFPGMVCAAEDPNDVGGEDPAADPQLGHPDTRWFEQAKFGLFVHWGLYSALGNEWKGRSYYGSGEWIMQRAKIPAAEYAELARTFNPVGFDADEWARFARETGARYMVVTAKHHEGFAMFASKVSPFNIVDATPYAKDPMATLASACRREGLKFGFYYSQFLDWHEPNGGGNRWDFDEKAKEPKIYYAEKSIPQVKELLSNYGPLGLVWFDMPGGLSREETVSFIREVRRLQPQCLISSRVGRGFGDFRDFGDSESPPGIVPGPWEALFTHNDSWGFVGSDLNFKTPQEIIRLLAATAARGGNLLLNVGPDGNGRIPPLSMQYLREVGRWLATNGASIYDTTHSPIPDQPWGVATQKPGQLFLHVFNRPSDGNLIVPEFSGLVKRVRELSSATTQLRWKQGNADLTIELPNELSDARDSVVVIEFSGSLTDAWQTPAIISEKFATFSLDVAQATLSGKTALKSITHSRYFGNWKHDLCAVGMESTADQVEFALRVMDPGDYRVTLEYACIARSKSREGIVVIDGQSLGFETLLTTPEFNQSQPLMFVRHAIGIINIAKTKTVLLSVSPKNSGAELFWLRRIVLDPIK